VAKKKKKRVLALCHSDCVPAPGALAELASRLVSHELPAKEAGADNAPGSGESWKMELHVIAQL